MLLHHKISLFEVPRPAAPGQGYRMPARGWRWKGLPGFVRASDKRQ
jgi:hypothetical protein